MGGVIAGEVERKIDTLPGVAEVEVKLVWEPQWNRDMMSEAALLQLGIL
jgi:metal-sulfur cluster biosynthetic enzyme